MRAPRVSCCVWPDTAAGRSWSAPRTTSRPSPAPSRRAPQSEVEIVGSSRDAPPAGEGLRSLGSLNEIGKAIDGNRVDEVIVVDPDFPERELLELVERAHSRGVRVRIAPSTTEILIHRAEFVPGQSIPLFELRPPVFEGIDFALKRSFDLIVATL